MQRNEQPTPDVSKIETTTLINRRWLSEGVFEVEFSRPPHLRFNAGHSIRLFYYNIGRYYSPVSAPADPTLRFCINHIAKGVVTPVLARVDPGYQMGLTGPHGHFNFSASSRPPVFIATDTGIAPFVSMARSGIKGFALLQGARKPDELYYQDVLGHFVEHYIPFVWDTADQETVSSGEFHGRMVDLLAQHCKPGRYDFYLCGWQKMIKDITLTIDTLYPDSHVYTEVFYS